MPTRILNILEPQNSDANFRAWGLALHGALEAVGLVQTADTGQIGWATVAYPATMHQVKGYEIWRFNDALQETAPVYIKLEYACGGAAYTHGLFITVGTGTNGAGTLTGAGTRVEAYAATALTTGQYSQVYVSGDTNRIAVFGFMGCTNSGTGTAIAFAVERTKDAAGADTGEAILMFQSTTSGGAWKQQAIFPAGAGSAELTLGIMMPTVGTGANGIQIAVYPQFFTKGVFLNPGMNMLAYHNPNLSALTPTNVTFYGATHIYLPLGTTCFQGLARTGPGSTTGAAPMIRWE